MYTVLDTVCVHNRVHVYTAVCGPCRRGQDRVDRCVLGLYTAVCMAQCTRVGVNGRVHGYIYAVYRVVYKFTVCVQGPVTAVHTARTYGCAHGRVHVYTAVKRPCTGRVHVDTTVYMAAYTALTRPST